MNINIGRKTNNKMDKQIASKVITSIASKVILCM